MTLVSTVGGAAGPLYGTFFLQLGKAAGDAAELDLPQWAAALRAGVEGVQMRGKAEPGDKTMVDALLPAAAALDEASAAGRSLGEALRRLGRRRRAGHARDRPAGGAQGPRQLPRRAQRRPPGSGCDVVLAPPRGAADRGTPAGARPVPPMPRPSGRWTKMVSLVLVCHSARLAEGTAELAGPDGRRGLRIAAAGGLDQPGAPLGTDAVRVMRAIEEVWSEDGVLVLMDLGSAVLSAEMAVDLLPEERRGAVLLTAAPFVEGAVAAAVAAGLGDGLEEVARRGARRSGRPRRRS